MKTIKYSLLTLFLLFGSSVLAMSVDDSAVSGNGSHGSNGQELKSSDTSRDATANGDETHTLEAAYKRLETTHKDPRNYSKQDH